MTTVDWIIVVLLAGSALVGLLQGFVRSVFTAAGIVGGLILASWNYQGIGRPLTGPLHDSQLANAIGFLVITGGVMIVGALLGSFFSRLLHKMGLGCIDRIVGAVFGLVQGFIVVTVAILVTVAFYPKQAWLTESRLPRYFFSACHLSTHVTPDSLAQKVQDELKILEAASPDWLHRATPSR